MKVSQIEREGEGKGREGSQCRQARKLHRLCDSHSLPQTLRLAFMGAHTDAPLAVDSVRTILLQQNSRALRPCPSLVLRNAQLPLLLLLLLLLLLPALQPNGDENRDAWTMFCPTHSVTQSVRAVTQSTVLDSSIQWPRRYVASHGTQHVI